jgi:hypothetical protein
MMGWIRHNGDYPKGAGDMDADLADKIFNAPTRRAAEAAVSKTNGGDVPHTDAAGRKIGLTGVEDAIDWLVSRSPGKWAG